MATFSASSQATKAAPRQTRFAFFASATASLSLPPCLEKLLVSLESVERDRFVSHLPVPSLVSKPMVAGSIPAGCDSITVLELVYYHLESAEPERPGFARKCAE
jgi:hypothetical protein